MVDFLKKLEQARVAAAEAAVIAHFQSTTLGQRLAASADPVDRMDSQAILALEKKAEAEHRIVEITPADVLPLNKDGMPIPGGITPRKEVLDFALAMEAKLAMNDHKEGWKECGIWHLFRALGKEVEELQQEMMRYTPDASNILQECADIANFAMMIADVAQLEAQKR